MCNHFPKLFKTIINFFVLKFIVHYRLQYHWPVIYTARPNRKNCKIIKRVKNMLKSGLGNSECRPKHSGYNLKPLLVC